MGNSDCKRCFTRDKEKDSEIKLGPEYDNKDDFDIDINSPKMTNINETVAKEEANILNSDLNNFEKYNNNNFLDEKKNKSNLNNDSQHIKNDSSFIDEENDNIKNLNNNLNNNLEEQEINDNEINNDINNYDQKQEDEQEYNEQNDELIQVKEIFEAYRLYLSKGKISRDKKESNMHYNEFYMFSELIGYDSDGNPEKDRDYSPYRSISAVMMFNQQTLNVRNELNGTGCGLIFLKEL